MHHDDEKFVDEERDTFEVSRRTCVVLMPPLMSAIKSAISCGISWSTADAVTVQPMVELHPKNAAPIVTPSAKLCTRSPRMTFQHTGCRVMMSVNTLSLLASIKTWRFCEPMPFSGTESGRVVVLWQSSVPVTAPSTWACLVSGGCRCLWSSPVFPAATTEFPCWPPIFASCRCW